MAKIMIVATVDQHIRHFHLPLIKALIQRGHEVYIASNGKEVFDGVTQKYHLPFQRNPFHFDNIRAYKNLKKIIENGNFDVIHVNTPVGSVVGRLAAKKSRKNGLKVIYTAHGFHFFKGAPKKNWVLFYPVEKFLMRYTDVLITMNSEDFHIARKMASNNSNVLIKKTNGVGVNLSWEKLSDYEIEGLKKQYKLQNSKIITCVAEISNRKNQIELINAFAKIKNKELINLKLLLIGDGGLKDSLETLVNDMDLSGQIIFTGYRPDVNGFLQISDVLVSSSKQEGLPVNIIEAMIHGLPIVASRIRGHVDLLSEYSNGELYELGNLDSLINAINQSLMKDKKKYDLSKYSTEAVTMQILEVYSFLNETN